MIGNYLTSAFRALQRDKFHALLNIAGLTVSLAVTFLIALYVKHELSYENFITEPEQVYSTQYEFHWTGEAPNPLAWGAPYGLFTSLREDFSSQLLSTFVFRLTGTVRVGDQMFREEIGAIDESFFEVLDFPFAFGSTSSWQAEPGTVVLTESAAEKYFGRSNVIGEPLGLDEHVLEVVAVMKDVPVNSDLEIYDVLVSALSPQFAPPEEIETRWWPAIGTLFTRLREGGDIRIVESQIPTMADRDMSDEEKEFVELSASFIRLDKLHLGLAAFRGNRTAIGALSGVALLLCAIACFNYVNLSTARAVTRTKEVGIRKVLGAKKNRLVVHYLSEALLTTSISFVLALAIAALLLPVFSVMVNRILIVEDLVSPFYLLVTLVLTLIISLLSGAYPALFLASAKPRELFEKQKLAAGSRGNLRSIIVGAQFSLAVGLIVATSVLYAQSIHMQSLDFGFDEEGVLIIKNVPDGEVAALREAYNRRLEQSPAIQKVASSSVAPQLGYDFGSAYSRLDDPAYERLAALDLPVDDSFFDLYGMPALAGRVFSESMDDRPVREVRDDGYRYFGHIVISESAVSYFGFSSPQEAVGKMILRGNVLREIIGVVPDIHFHLAHSPIAPTVYFYTSTSEGNDELEVTSVRPSPDSAGNALEHARYVWEDMFPGYPFEYEYLEDRIAIANAEEQRQSRLFISLTGLAILVTCLGLFGLVSFVATHRSREIAIRKVLGAKVSDVSRMLVWEFAKPILVASLIAWPTAWVLMRRWLDGFPYRIELSPWFFIGATALALAVAFLTVIRRTWKAAQTHPAQALKYE